MRTGRPVPFSALAALAVLLLFAFSCDTGSSGDGSLAGSAGIQGVGNAAGINVLIPSLKKKTSTDGSGNFAIGGIPPGTYLAVAEDNAYQWQERKTVTIREGETTRVDFALARDLSIGTVAGAVPRSSLPPDGMTLVTHVRGNYAFLGDQAGGVPIVDVSDPASPFVVTTIRPLASAATPPAKSYQTYCTEDGNYLVVANNVDGALFYDVTDKGNPLLRRQVYEVDSAYGGDDPYPSYPYPVSPGKRIILPMSVNGAGDTVYVGGWNTLLVFDISSRANPVLVTGFNVSGEGADLQVDGNRLYFATDNLAIFDIADRKRPVRVGTYANGGAGVAASGSFAALSHVTAGLEFVDVSNPSSPRSLVTFPVESQGGDASWDGYFYAATARSMTVYRADPATLEIRSVYSSPVVTEYAMNVAVSGDYAYVSDRSEGLKIVKIK